MRHTTIGLGALLAFGTLATAAAAQARSRDGAREATREATREVHVYRSGAEAGDDDRAVLGIGTGSSSERDTLGLLVTSVTPGSPAEQAGIEEGNRIAAINSVNLRLSRDDAGEGDMQGLTSRRLTREMAKVKAGDMVELKVWTNGAYRTVKVKTIAADELSPRRARMTRDDMEGRPVLGISLSSGGSRRDSLGVLVVGLDEKGPAEKAGLIEGDRIQAINGVNLRTSGEDAGDAWVASARASRFRRELQKVKVGERLQLSVWSGGQVKTVSLAPVRADSLGGSRRRGFNMSWGDGGFTIAPMPPMAPMAPMPPMPARAPRPPMEGMRFMLGDMDIDGTVRVNLDQARAALRASADQLRAAAPYIVHATPRTVVTF